MRIVQSKPIEVVVDSPAQQYEVVGTSNLKERSKHKFYEECSAYLVIHENDLVQLLKNTKELNDLRKQKPDK